MSNILLNRSFESGSFDNWSTIAGTPTKSSAFAYDGTYSCKFTNPSSSYSGRGIESDQVAAIAGVTYTFGIWIYIEDVYHIMPSSSSTTHIRGRFKFYDSSHSFLSYGYHDPAPGHDDWGWTNTTIWDAWVYKSFSFVAPAGTAYISMFLEAREVDNPSPPPSGQPGNNVYLDYGIIDEGAVLYSDDDFRIVAAVGLPHSEDGFRVYGYSMGPITPQDDFRIFGKLFDNVDVEYFRVKGEIIENTIWLDEPDPWFLKMEDSMCNAPRKKLLLFHSGFPDNSLPGPGGELKYIDVTERVISYGRVNNTIPSTPSDIPQIIMSDLSVELDNSDYYFTTDNENSPYYGLGNYIGWKDGGRVELWAGFKVSLNTAHVVIVAKMVIVNIDTVSREGTATMYLRAHSARIFDRKMGLPDSSTGASRPYEEPTLYFTAGSNDFLKFRTDLSGPTWTTIGIGSGWRGKITRGIMMQEELNKAYGSGGLVTAAETFTVTFDEETQLYTFAASGVSYFQIWTDGCAGASHWGFLTGVIYPPGGGPGSGITEIESAFSLSASTITLSHLMENILINHGGFSASDIDIETVTTLFKSAWWSEVSLMTCLSDVVFCGCGAIWMTSEGKIIFRTFENMPSTVAKKLRGDKNYSSMRYSNQNAITKIRKISLSGKFQPVYSEYDSGVEVGSEYVLSSSILENQTLADTIVKKYYARYNVEPSKVTVKAEYLPSVFLADSATAYPPGSVLPLHGQIVSSSLGVGEFVNELVLLPFTCKKTWATREDWEDYDAEDPNSRLYIPHDENDLQMKLMEYQAGFRDYIFDCDLSDPAAQAKWLDFIYTAKLDHGISFLDHFDEVAWNRYSVISPELDESAVDGPAGTWFSDSVLKEVEVNSMGTNYGTFLLLNNFLDTSPAEYIDYMVKTHFKIDGILDADTVNWQTWGTQSSQHYYGMLMRCYDSLNLNYSLSRAVKGNADPMIGKIVGGNTQYINAVPSASAHVPFETWIEATMKISSGVMEYSIEDYAALSESISPIFNPWNGPAQAGFGFSKCKGRVRRIEISSANAPDAPAPTFQFATKATPAASWSGFSSSLPSGPSKYIKIRVTMSRGTKYSTVPMLEDMTIAYTPA